MPQIFKKNLENSNDSRTYLDASKRTIAILNSVFLGRGIYKPGWRWSTHVGQQTGKKSEAHIGYVLSGSFMVKGADGIEVEVGPGDAFEVQAGHDAWVLGEEPCVALDFGLKR